jgi:hypothetical protein
MSFVARVKNFFRTCINSSVHRRHIYAWVWHPVIRACNLAQREHFWVSLNIPGAELQRAVSLLSENTVLHGPFEGLRYPGLQAAGSAIFPKLIGSYERELHPVVGAAMREGYTDLVDIGCAEGYYAVGFALKLPDLRVWAFDTDAGALEMCRRMAELNGVAGRISFSGRCDATVLAKLPITGRALIFSDCEGFERSLFSQDICKSLAAHDFIIEIHDFIDPFISVDLERRLRPTHEVRRIRTISDSVRPDVYTYPELAAFSPDVKIQLLAELRPAYMEWFVCYSRKSSAQSGSTGTAMT